MTITWNQKTLTDSSREIGGRYAALLKAGFHNPAEGGYPAVVEVQLSGLSSKQVVAEIVDKSKSDYQLVRAILENQLGAAVSSDDAVGSRNANVLRIVTTKPDVVLNALRPENNIKHVKAVVQLNA